MNLDDGKLELILNHYPDALVFVEFQAGEKSPETHFKIVKSNKKFDKILSQNGLSADKTDFSSFLKNCFDDKLVKEAEQFKNTGSRQKEYIEEHYSPLLHRWYKITIYFVSNDIIAFIFHDITHSNHTFLTMEKISRLAGKQFAFPAEDSDFEIFTEDLLELSGARFAACNSYDNNGTISTTRSISGLKELIKKAANLLGFGITGKQWEAIPRRLDSLSGGKLVRFENLYEASFGAISQKTAYMLEKVFKIGEVYVIEIRSAGILIGDFIIFMPAGKSLDNKQNIETYVKQAGSIIIAENKLHKQLRFQKMVSKIFTAFVNATPENINQAIDHALHLSGEFFNADRSYLFMFSDDGETMDNTNEWCAFGVEPQMDRITDTPVANQQWIIDRIVNNDFFQVEDVEDLPPEAAYDKEEFGRQGIKSLFAVRLLVEGKVIGFIGYDSVKEKRLWEEEITLARVIAEIITISLNRHFTEKFLLASEKKFRTYTENAPLGIIIVNRRGRYIEVNNEACRMSGFTENEFLNMTIEDFIAKEFKDDGLRLFGEMLQEGSARGTIKVRHKEREPFWIDILAKKISDDRYIAFCVDISIQKDFERALKDSERQYRTLLSNVPGTIFRCANDLKYTMFYISGSIEEISGYKAADFINNSKIAYNDIVHPEDRNSLQDTIQKAIESEQNYTARYRILGKNDEIKWVYEAGKGIYDEDEKALYIDGLILDITENKKNEEALKKHHREIELKNTELENARNSALEASKAKSNFLSTMSHEIRTPMNAILGMAELLADTELTPEQRRYVDIARSSGENLLSLINSILDISRIEAGHIKLYENDFSLPDLVEKTVDIIGLKAKEKGLELYLRMDQKMNVLFRGDSDKLQQVILNLLNNAVKFTEKGNILLEYMEINQTDEKHYVLFTVTDTGIGIPPDKLETIFDEFTQIDSSITRKYEGSGLGLNISRHLVRLMGGDIGVMSMPGEGSSFYFTVPLKKPHEELPEQDISTAFDINLEGIRILVADDNKINRLIIKEILAPKGAEIIEKDNGRKAFDELARAKESKSPYHLVLLDVMMPSLDGLSVASQIKKEIPETKIIIISSAIESLREGKSSKTNIDAYLMKPVKRELLFQTINSILKEEIKGDLPDTASINKPADADICQKPVTEKSFHDKEMQDNVKTAHCDKDGKKNEKEAPKEDLSSYLKNSELLLVEDNSDNRMLIETFMKNSDYAITTVENGEEAVEKIKRKYENAKNRYSIVLMDIQMPVMDGYEATREIRKWESENHISPTPIVALTAYALKSEIQKALDAGCDAHLAKPINKLTLLETVEKYALK